MNEYERTTVERTVDEPVVPAAPTPPGTRILGTSGDPPAPLTAQSTVVRERTVARSGRIDAMGIVTLIFGILQALLLLRIVLLVLIANHDNAIVGMILAISDPFVEPFRGMFRLDAVAGRSGSVLDVAALVALVGWTLVEALVVAVLRLGDRQRTVGV
jgi:uncharacterized protein YggT (Ycf19 family)